MGCWVKYRCKEKILHRISMSGYINQYNNIKREIHLLAQRRDISTDLRQSLPPIMMLVQLVAERPKDGQDLGRLVAHCDVGCIRWCAVVAE